MADVVALGEIMLRLKPPGHERFLQSPVFEATFGGSEANVMISLAILGLETRFVTALPSNGLGDACIRFLRGFGVRTQHIVRSSQRMGLYFFEAGASQRPSQVIYDRAHSAMATIAPDAFDWAQIFAGASWFHISGITPAISASAAELSRVAVREAKARGLTVSLDFNYRSKLWRYGQSPAEVMGDLIRYVDLLVAGEKDAGLLGLDYAPEEGQTPDEALSRAWFRAFPNIRYHVTTHRMILDATHHRLSARLATREAVYTTREYDIPGIVDRIGGGDAFMAGLIYGLVTGMGEEEALAFATGAAVLKHAIPGDVNLATRDEIWRLVSASDSGRVQR